MNQLKRLEEITAVVREQGRKRLAVAYAQDPNTIESIGMALKEGIIDAFMIGDKDKIIATAQEKNIDPDQFNIVHVPDETQSAKEAVRMVRDGEADVLMKGLVSTDKYLKAILDKEKGLLPPGNVMSHVCIVDIPAYRKLIFLADTAVIPFPTLDQKIAMLQYTIATAHKFGVKQPKAALLTATEKVNPKFQATIDASIICKMADRGQIKGAIVDGPLDLFLACDPSAVEIKGVDTPIAGDADILIFPTIEASNLFYKGVMLFAGGELAGLMQGTTHPVIVTSRSESTLSKYYSIAAGCLTV